MSCCVERFARWRVPGSRSIGIVVIGRNEALRLRDVLERALEAHVPTVYVDSASSDDSADTVSYTHLTLPTTPYV